MAGSQKASVDINSEFGGTYASTCSKCVYCSDKKLIPRIKEVRKLV